ncbi:hypothetical protein GCM10010172_17620 [Paractinoplanes ferrugineus]
MKNENPASISAPSATTLEAGPDRAADFSITRPVCRPPSGAAADGRERYPATVRRSEWIVVQSSEGGASAREWHRTWQR